MTEKYTSKQAASLKNTIDSKNSLVGTVTLHVRMVDCKARVVSGHVCNKAVPVEIGNRSIDNFVKGILPPER